MANAVIACDLGTGGVKSVVVRPDGAIVAERVMNYDTLYPAPGFHEQRPTDWWSAVAGSIRALVELPEVQTLRIGAIAISGHSLGCVPIDATGRLLQNAVPIWSDGRAGGDAERFFAEHSYDEWYKLTGNGFPAPLYTVFKIMWLKRNLPDVFDATATVLGTKDYVNFRLTGRRATDPSYASGTGVYDLRAGGYSAALLADTGLSRDLFADIVAATDIIGEVLPDVAADLGLPASVKVVAGGVDNSCMALGARTYREGDIFCSMGSSSWLTVATANPIADERVLPYTFAHVVPGMFISATSIFSSGTSLDWVRDTLLPDVFAEASKIGRDPYKALMQLAEAAAPSSGGLLFVPTLAGGTNLEGGPTVRGGFVGLDLSHSRAQILRASLEGVALALRVALDELRAMRDLGDEIIIVGGGARSALWRQIFADIFGCAILKTEIDQQAAAIGAAALALVGIGLWRDFSPLIALHQRVDLSRPDPARSDLVRQMLETYCIAAEHQRLLSAPLARLRAMTVT